jgi:integrase/recombinase XerC
MIVERGIPMSDVKHIEQITLNSTIMDGFYYVANVKKWDEKTYEAYYGDMKILERFLMLQGVNPLIRHVNEKLIRDFLFAMRKEKASSTVRRYHGTISRIYKRLEREKIRNVLIDIELPPLQHSAGRYLTYDECVDILIFADELLENEHKDIRLTVRFMLYTGLRNDVLQKFEVCFLDMNQGLLRIPSEVSKRGEPQILPLTAQLLERTESYIIAYQLKDDDLLLPGLSGKTLYNRQLNRITDRINNYFNWKEEQKVTPHVFRATLSTLLDDMEISGDIIDFILNHHPKSVREKHYSRSTARKLRESKGALDTFESKIEQMYEKKKQQTVVLVEDQPIVKGDPPDQPPLLSEVMTKVLSEMIQSNPQILLSLTQQFLQNPDKKK